MTLRPEIGPSVDERKADNRRSFWHLVSAWVPVVICVLTIAVESTPYFGSDQTSGPLRRLVEYFFGPVPGFRWWQIHHAIRKTGHFTGYGILSASWFRAFWMTIKAGFAGGSFDRRRLAAHGLAILGTFLVASGDEFHQTFVPNRTGTPWDVLLDCTGAMAVQVLIWIVLQPKVMANRAA